MYRRPSAVGVTLSDSTFRRAVIGPGPAYTVLGGKEVAIYAAPGCAVLPAATEQLVSTMCVFWGHFRNYVGRVVFFLFPYHEALGSSNWSSTNRRTAEEMLTTGKAAKHVLWLPTINELLTKCGYDVKEEPKPKAEGGKAKKRALPPSFASGAKAKTEAAAAAAAAVEATQGVKLRQRKHMQAYLLGALTPTPT